MTPQSAVIASSLARRYVCESAAPDVRARIALVEVDERHQLLGRLVRGRRQHPVASGAPAVARPTGHQITDVDGEGVRVVRRVLPAALVREHLEAALAGLPVEDGDRAEVGVRADPELAGLRRRRRCPGPGTS